MPTGVRMPVESMSIRALIGIVKELATPGMVRASFISSLSCLERHAGAPLGFGLEVDHGLEHLQRRRVGRGLGAARLAEDLGHLRDLLQQPVLHLQELGGDRDGAAGTVTGM